MVCQLSMECDLRRVFGKNEPWRQYGRDAGAWGLHNEGICFSWDSPCPLGCGDVPLFNLSDSRNMLNYCDENDVAVLGMEGFKVVGKKEFQIWNVLRISSLVAAGEGFPGLSRKSARNFLDSIQDLNVFLEFVLVTV